MVAGPVARFMLGSLVAIAVIVVGGFFALRKVAIEEAERDTRERVQARRGSSSRPACATASCAATPRRSGGSTTSSLGKILGGSVVRVKLWTRDGTILYSDEPALIGQRFALGEDELELFETGGAEAELSDLAEPENRYERPQGKLLEAHTVIRTPDGTPVLFEIYQRFSSVSASGRAAAARARAAADRRPARARALPGAARLVAGAAPAARPRGARGAARERGRGVDAASAAGSRPTCTTASCRTSPASRSGSRRSPTTPSAAATRGGRARCATRRRTLRQGVRDLRTLLVEIHPPNLASAGLRRRAQRPAQPARGRGHRDRARRRRGRRAGGERRRARLPRRARGDPQRARARRRRVGAGRGHASGAGHDAARRHRRRHAASRRATASAAPATATSA